MQKPSHNAPTHVNRKTPTSLGDYTIITQVGEGTYGRVYKARHKQTNALVALKVLFNIEEEEGLSFTAIREIKYLQQLASFKNVVKLEGTFFSPEDELVLVFEYMDHDLSGLLSIKDVNFTEAQRKYLLKQVLEGLDQCHSSGIMHRDVKAANLLMGQDKILKIADFGLATDFVRRQEFSTNVVTLWYRAPELLLGVNKYGPKVDMWSAGCIFIELLTRRSPFPGREEKHQLDLIVRTCGTPTEQSWPGVTKLPEFNKLLRSTPRYPNRLDDQFKNIDKNALDLLKKLLTLDPEKRISASEALDHDYFWTDPMPCQSSQFPTYPSMHEFEAKRTREPVPRAPEPAHHPAPANPSKPTASARFGRSRPPLHPGSQQNPQQQQQPAPKNLTQNMHNVGVRPEPMKRNPVKLARRNSTHPSQSSHSTNHSVHPSQAKTIPRPPAMSTVHTSSQPEATQEPYHHPHRSSRQPAADHHDNYDHHRPMSYESQSDLSRKRKRINV